MTSSCNRSWANFSTLYIGSSPSSVLTVHAYFAHLAYDYGTIRLTLWPLGGVAVIQEIFEHMLRIKFILRKMLSDKHHRTPLMISIHWLRQAIAWANLQCFCIFVRGAYMVVSFKLISLIFIRCLNKPVLVAVLIHWGRDKMAVIYSRHF